MLDDDDGPAPSDLRDWYEPRRRERCRCGDMPGHCPGPENCPLCEAGEPDPEDEKDGSDASA